VLQVTLPAPTGSGGWGDAFSVTVYGTSAANQFVTVSDAGRHTLTEYSYSASTNAVAQVGTAFTFPSDPAGGAISPQEIAIDSSGNLWTTSAGGAVTEYCGNSAGCTIGSTHYAAGASMQTATIPTADGAPRGIMINGSTLYVTTSSYGALTDNVFDFTLSSGVAGALTGYAALGSSTIGGQETGQLRGITFDSHGDVFYADSTWAPSGTNDGYINENIGTTAIVTGLAGPNGLETGNGPLGNCNALYVANYYGGTVGVFQTGYKTDGTAAAGCGNGIAGGSVGAFVTIAGQDVSGIALAFGNGGLGDDVTGVPSGLFGNATASPEPATGALVLGALLLSLAMGMSRRSAQPKPV
jgi:hypothetical protein